MEVRWLTTALRNLDDEAEFVGKDNTESARPLVGRNHEAVMNLKVHPALVVRGVSTARASWSSRYATSCPPSAFPA